MKCLPFSDEMSTHSDEMSTHSDEMSTFHFFLKISFISNFFSSCKDKYIGETNYEIFNGQLFRIR